MEQPSLKFTFIYGSPVVLGVFALNTCHAMFCSVSQVDSSKLTHSWGLEMVSGQNIRKIFQWSWCGSWTVCSGRFQSSSSILSRTLGWKVRSSGTVLSWSWCCTGMTSTRCLAFQMRSLLRRFLMLLPGLRRHA